MNYLAVLLLIVYATVSINGEDCFDKEKLNTFRKELVTKATDQVKAECKKNNSESTDEQLSQCAKKKGMDAYEECIQDNPKEDLTKTFSCVSEKLKINLDEDFATYNTTMSDLSVQDKKKTVEDAIAPCADEEEKNIHTCAIDKLKEVCPDIKKMLGES
uniref:Uncharacterized protein n=1 Tax=Strigamia maritima TaxID=126957 RepID=T1ILZ2_STRMM